MKRCVGETLVESCQQSIQKSFFLSPLRQMTERQINKIFRSGSHAIHSREMADYLLMKIMAQKNLFSFNCGLDSVTISYGRSGYTKKNGYQIFLSERFSRIKGSADN